MRPNRVVVALCAMAIAACGSPSSGLLPPPSSTSTTSTTPTTAPVDHSKIALEAFPGEPTTTVPISEGRATVRGVVVGPDGAVPGATVKIERLVGEVVQRTDVGTDGNGGFILSGVPGGRYRVRAFQSPRLTMMDAEIFFLADGDDRELRLDTEVFEGLTVSGSTTPAQPIVGQGVNLAVRVAQRTVDGDGIGREAPSAGVRVQVRTSGWEVLGPDGAGPTTTTTTTTTEPDSDDDVGGDDGDDGENAGDDGENTGPVERVTDGDGIIVFQFRCDRVGSTSATVILGAGADEQTFPLEVPPCAPVPTTTTTSTTTAAAGGGGSTTTEP